MATTQTARSTQPGSSTVSGALRRAGVAAAAVALLAGAGVAAADTASAAARPALVSAGVPSARHAIKMNYGGLYGSSNTDRLRTGEDHLWFKTTWASLEPSNGHYRWTAIDAQLRRNPTVKIRIHVLGGASAPAWLKAKAGSVTVSNGKDGVNARVGKYWTKAYMASYRTFVTAMGSRYDKHASTYDRHHLVASVNDAGTSLVYDEPWIMGGKAPAAKLFTAGLNKTTARTAQSNALKALTAAFPTTVIEMPLHSQWTYPVSGGQAGTWAGGRALANSWDALYGSHVIFTDYGLGPNEYTAAAKSLRSATSLYSWMHKRANLGRPIGFQATLVHGAAGSARPSAAAAASACNAAVAMGARWFEHSSWSILSTTAAKHYDKGLKASV